jgi:hypothetical protein
MIGRIIYKGRRVSHIYLWVAIAFYERQQVCLTLFFEGAVYENKGTAARAYQIGVDVFGLRRKELFCGVC